VGQLDIPGWHIPGLVGKLDIHGSHISGLLGVLNIPGWRIPGLLIDEQITLPSFWPHLVSFRSWLHSHLTNILIIIIKNNKVPGKIQAETFPPQSNLKTFFFI
jgi:hypothetical protein